MNISKAAKNRIISFILILCCLFSLCSCYKETTIEKSSSASEISAYVNDLTGIDLSQYIYEAEMEVEKGNEEYAYIKIRIKYNMAPDIKKIMKEKTNVDDSPYLKIPAFKGHRYAKTMKEMDITGHYIKVWQGKVIATRDIDIYTAGNVNDGKDSYVFIFG